MSVDAGIHVHRNQLSNHYLKASWESWDDSLVDHMPRQSGGAQFRRAFDVANKLANIMGL
jgi:hypothetical protein